MLEAERALKAAELTEFNASIETAGAQLALANQELERLERLRRSAAFSVAKYQDKLRDVERFKSALAEARAKADQAKAQLRMADINLHNAQIRAPFDGVITQRHVDVGNYVSVGNKVITVLNDESLEVEAEVPANRLGGLGPQVEIEARSEFGAPFKATVRAIVPEENALARTWLVRFTPRFTADNKNIAANQSVILHIPAGAPRIAITVHKDAITQRRGQRVVFVADGEQKKVSMRPVDLGDAFGARFEVLAGLRPGDKVVVKGNERLRAGQEIRVQSAGSEGSGKGRRGEGRKGRKQRGEDAVNGKRGGS
jgi:RND family efflux transporter MFP subunit